MAQRSLRAALVQILVGKHTSENLKKASNFISEAATRGARLVTLPEFFCFPVDPKYFKVCAESVPNGPICKMLAKAARKNRIYVIGGSISEISDRKYYNTCTVWNPEGELVTKYRKLHLFDVRLHDNVDISESNYFVPGEQVQTFDIDNVKVGLGICYDIRFEEIAMLHRLQGCELLVYPSAFEVGQGALIWKNVQITRAIDNQSYVLGVSQARCNAGYITWGYSQVTNPWGKILARAGINEEILFCDLDFTECDKIRRQMPKLIHRRTDVYKTSCK